MKLITRISTFGTQFFIARLYHGSNIKYAIKHINIDNLFDISDICCIVYSDGSIEFHNYPCNVLVCMQVYELNRLIDVCIVELNLKYI